MSLPYTEVQLSGRAARFLFLLRDFGHITEEGVDRLLLGAADLRDPSSSGPLELEDVRRAASMLLFAERDGDLSEGLLGSDWPILFS